MTCALQPLQQMLELSFTTINTAMMKNNITCVNFVSAAVDNISVNVGRSNSVIFNS